MQPELEQKPLTRVDTFDAQPNLRAASSRVTRIWQQPLAPVPFTTGVSLHGHTSCSEESLTFIHKMFAVLPGLGLLFRYYERRSVRDHGLQLDFEKAHWRPPLQPRMAYALEAQQMERLGLKALVSLTDHDTIEAPMLLRTVDSTRHIPTSVEWTTPFGNTIFHMGIHNLPSADGPDWMRRFTAFTARACAARSASHADPRPIALCDAEFLQLLGELHACPQVLTILNHPLWDLYTLGPVHEAEMRRFLTEAGATVHALELNGLRNRKENALVERLAAETGHLLLSGGDRHGLEPNACINLTNATTFTDFVAEVRVARRSHVLYMQQYKQSWLSRIMASTLTAVEDHPEFVQGWQMWDERAFHPDANGVMRPLRSMWVNGRPPLPLRLAIGFVRMAASRTLPAQATSRTAAARDKRGLERV